MIDMLYFYFQTIWSIESSLLVLKGQLDSNSVHVNRVSRWIQTHYWVQANPMVIVKTSKMDFPWWQSQLETMVDHHQIYGIQVFPQIQPQLGGLNPHIVTAKRLKWIQIIIKGIKNLQSPYPSSHENQKIVLMMTGHHCRKTVELNVKNVHCIRQSLELFLYWVQLFGKHPELYFFSF